MCYDGGMKAFKFQTVITANIVFDLVPLIYSVALTAIAYQTAGTDSVVAVATIPVIVIALLDILSLYSLGLKRGTGWALKLLIGYYAVTRAGVAFLLLGSLSYWGPALILALLIELALAGVTLQAMYDKLQITKQPARVKA
jgi:hypothetical protein